MAVEVDVTHVHDITFQAKHRLVTQGVISFSGPRARLSLNLIVPASV